MSASQPAQRQTPRASRSRFSLNAPRPIFLGWTAMILTAGFGYYYVKTKNLAKRKELMREERLAMIEARQDGRPDDDDAMQRHLVKEQRRAQASTEPGQRSPLQNLLDQINKQTSQRRRAES
ncbi:unnamed protein product [Parajaminaea phylloscopi]